MNKDTGVSRRALLGASGAVLAAGLNARAAVPPPADGPRRPNLIFFMPDELRAESVACYGNSVVHTPNLDGMAREGVRFSNCFVQNPVCGPSRCSLMTGWPVHVHGHRSLYYFLRPDEPNLFRYLRRGGYDVYWHGKNDLLAAASFADSVTEWDPGHNGPSARTENPWPLDDPRHYSFLYREGGDPKDYSDYANVSAAIRILERPNPPRPYCIFLPLGSPHPPYTAPKGFHNMYAPAALPPLRPVRLPGKPSYHAGIREMYRLGQLPEEIFRKIQAVYLGKVSYTDWLLGRLLDAVRQTQHDDDTFVFVFSDHGDYAGDYGLVEKWPSGLEDVLTHIPLIVRGPGLTGGHVSGEIVELFDVMPTCLELAGLRVEHTHFARSLLPQLHGESGDPDRAAYSEGGYNTYEPQCFEPLLAPPERIYYAKTALEINRPQTVRRAAMIRTREHKLIVRPGDVSELYDLSQDPRELHNRYGESSYRDIRLSLTARMLDWYVQTADVAPFDKDPRDLPPYYSTAEFPSNNPSGPVIDG
jgi:arylsulfatase A-like enzyme